MSSSAKRALAERLLKEAQQEESGTKEAHPNQDQDFDNPFNTASPKHLSQVWYIINIHKKFFLNLYLKKIENPKFRFLVLNHLQNPNIQ